MGDVVIGDVARRLARVTPFSDEELQFALDALGCSEDELLSAANWCAARAVSVAFFASFVKRERERHRVATEAGPERLRALLAELADLELKPKRVPAPKGGCGGLTRQQLAAIGRARA